MHMLSDFPPSGRGITLVFFSYTAITKFQGELHQQRVKYMEVGNVQFLTETAVYLGNDTR